MKTSDVILIAVLVLGPAILLWLIYLARTGKPGKPRVVVGIPQALRPGQSDEVLEGPRVERIQVGWLLSAAALAVFVPLYWLPESQRQEAFQERFDEESLHRGQLIFSVPPQLEEDISAVDFKEQEKGVALGQGCAACHGSATAPEGAEENIAAGGFANPKFKDPATGETVQYRAPPLNNVFQRWDEEVIRFTIERGRPGTPMPAWGVDFGGSMTDLMISDVIMFLKSLPGNNQPPPAFSPECSPPQEEPAEGEEEVEPEPLPEQCGQEIFEARCAVCHGPKGQGKEDPKLYSFINEDQEEEFFRVLYQGMALWRGDVRHLDKGLHFTTISNGRRFAFMPAWSDAPSQGIPVSPFPLTDQQIEAVMKYERSL